MLVVGVEDGTRRVIGIPDVLAAEERLSNMVVDFILPRLVPDIEIVPWRKTHALVVQVYLSAARPHYLARLGPHAGVFVRVGSTTRCADAAQNEEMRRFGQVGSFDEQPIPETNSEVLDFRAASEFFAPVRKLTPSAFRTLRITTKYQGRDVPTVGGYLLFGKDRFDRFPDAWVQAGRFTGKDRSRLADSTEIRSHLPQTAEEAIEFVQKHMSREALIGPVRRTDRWTVPLVALREAIINAIVHADYAERGSPIRVAIFDDRVEVENPGLFNEKDQTILRLLGDGRGRSTAQIAKVVALSARATRTRLADLVQRDLVVEVGSGPQDPRRQYFVSEGGLAE